MNFKEQIAAKREAAKSRNPEPEPTPETEPEPEFKDPAVRAEHLADQLTEARAELVKERERRIEAERKLAPAKPTLQQAFTKRARFK